MINKKELNQTFLFKEVKELDKQIMYVGDI